MEKTHARLAPSFLVVLEYLTIDDDEATVLLRLGSAEVAEVAGDFLAFGDCVREEVQ